MDADRRARLERVLGGPVRAARHLGGQHGVAHYRLELADGRLAFAKLATPAGPGPAKLAAAGGAGPDGMAAAGGAGPDGMAAVGGAGSAGTAADGGADPGLAAEASGLAWLAAAGAVAVPEVLAAADDMLVIEWVAPDEAGRRSALRFGRELAALHRAGADRFGAPWPGRIAGLPLPNGADLAGPGGGWGRWYAAARVLPYVRLARDAGVLGAADGRVVESAAARAAEVAGPAEPPSRIHGDCWSGNVLWSGGRGWLIDPAAHGGHRETDLAMLALFGAPQLEEILAAYQEAAPLADGWRDRVPLHQLHPLLVHVCLFGGSYVTPALAAARAVLAL